MIVYIGRVEVRKNTFIFNYKEFTYFIYKFIAPTCSEFVFPSPLTSITPIDFTDLSWIFEHFVKGSIIIFTR